MLLYFRVPPRIHKSHSKLSVWLIHFTQHCVHFNLAQHQIIGPDRLICPTPFLYAAIYDSHRTLPLISSDQLCKYISHTFRNFTVLLILPKEKGEREAKEEEQRKYFMLVPANYFVLSHMTCIVQSSKAAACCLRRWIQITLFDWSPACNQCIRKHACLL